MNTARKKITNPMTIIALFAALSETSAAVSLPFLDYEERQIYVWFLMTFPFSLILLFFMTLNFNYKSLYAPSDFEKGKHFIKILDDAARTEKVTATPSSPEQLEQNTADKEKDFHSPARLLKCPPQSFIFRQQKRRYSSRHAHDPPGPINIVINNAMQHTLHLPQTLHGLHIIDTRRTDAKKDVDTLITETGQNIGRKPDSRDLIIFITNQKSAQFINQSELDKLIKDEFSYIVYNLSTRALTQTCQRGNQP
jgi:hypothetical protein